MHRKEKKYLLSSITAAILSCSLAACGTTGGIPGNRLPRLSGQESEAETADESEALESVFDTDGYYGAGEAATESLTEALTEAMTEDFFPMSREEQEALLRAREQENMSLRHQLYYLRQLYGESFCYARAIPKTDPVPAASAPAVRPVHPVISGAFPNLEILRRYPAPLPEKTLPMLKANLEQIIAGYDGSWSVYVKDLNTGRAFTINDVPMKSASVLKLFVLGTVYRAIEAGELERTGDVVNLMSGMITASSNENTNALLYLLGSGSYADGIKKVNDFIQEEGYSSETVEYNGFQNAATVVDPNHFNQVGARDCGRFLEKVYRRTFGPRMVCSEIETWMLNQQHRSKIPAGIDSRSQVGNKTGETDDTENDVGIVYTPCGDYIVCILSNSWESKQTAQQRVAALSKEIYSYFMDDDYVSSRFYSAQLARRSE